MPCLPAKNIPMVAATGSFRCPDCNSLLEVRSFSFVVLWLFMTVAFYLAIYINSFIALVVVTVFAIIFFILGDLIPALLGLLEKKEEGQ